MKTWALVATMTDSKGRRGHRLFRHATVGRVVSGIAVADNSGSTPDTTEDGALWVESISFDNSRIIFHLVGGKHTCDELTEANAYAVARVAKAFGIGLKGTTYIGKLVAKDVL